jgi:hypothetical protein
LESAIEQQAQTEPIILIDWDSQVLLDQKTMKKKCCKVEID